jgi:hypothetical protein
MRQREGERVGLVLRAGLLGGLAGGGVELEELADPGGRGGVEPAARLGQVREPLEDVLARRGRVGQGLRVGDGLIPVVAGLHEELGVLAQDLQVLLPKKNG